MSARTLDPPRRVASLAIVLRDGRTFLIDATPDLPAQLQSLEDSFDPDASGVDRAPVDGIFLTHAHMGHYLGLAHFGFEALNSPAIPTWGTPAMLEFLRSEAPWDQLVRFENLELQVLIPDAAIALDDDVRILPFRVPHRDEYADTVGFIVEGPRGRVVYVPDSDRWAVWDPPLEARLEDGDTALLDATFFSGEELPGRDLEAIRHPFVRESLDRFGRGVREGRWSVWFTHLNHSNPALTDDSDARRELEAAGFGVAREGQTFPL
ncbi:MAG: MBL fold metallo-hydrolase [Planctomycetota bacterium]|nr:MBL fold metallo-hydrolase [Planctomycetota bacterium]